MTRTLLERAGQRLGDVGVDAGDDLVHALEDRDLGTEVGHHRRELTADRPATDHGGAGGHGGHRQDLVGGHHETAVDLETRQLTWHRTGAQQHALTADAGARAVGEVDGDRPVRAEASGAVVGLDLAALQQTLDALGELVDDALLAGHRLGEVEARLAGQHTEVVGLADRAGDRGGLEQLLGRDAAALQAGPAHLVPLDEADREARRCGVEGGAITGGTAADDDQVEVCVTHVRATRRGTENRGRDCTRGSASTLRERARLPT